LFLRFESFWNQAACLMTGGVKYGERSNPIAVFNAKQLFTVVVVTPTFAKSKSSVRRTTPHRGFC